MTQEGRDFAASEYADQRAHDVAWMTADERNELDKRAERLRRALQEIATWPTGKGTGHGQTCQQLARVAVEVDDATLNTAGRYSGLSA